MFYWITTNRTRWECEYGSRIEGNEYTGCS